MSYTHKNSLLEPFTAYTPSAIREIQVSGQPCCFYASAQLAQKTADACSLENADWRFEVAMTPAMAFVVVVEDMSEGEPGRFLGFL